MQPRPGRPDVTCIPLFAFALAAAIAAGLPFSPYFDTVLFWLGKTSGPAWAASPAVFHGTSVIVALGTLSIAAVPVLLARWLASRWISRAGLAAIWCVAAIAIAWPALRVAAGLDD